MARPFSIWAAGYASYETETGTLSGTAVYNPDVAASGGNAVLFAPEGTPPARSTMYVDGRHLYTAAGEKVIIRGVNEMFVWLGQNRWATTMAEINESRSNTVRIVWDTEGSSGGVGSPQNLDTVMGLAIQNKLIPVPELHGTTGDISGVPQMVDYWVRPEVVSVINKYEKWALLNIANEAGGVGVPDATFLSTYQTAITRLRNAGYTIPLVIDATQWGMNYDQIWRTWTQLRDHDPEQNLIFSLHSYWTGDPRTLYENVTARIVTDNIPVIVGEGPTALNASCQLNPHYEVLMQKLHEREIGWLGWSWGAVNNSGCTGRNEFDITSNGLFGSWEHVYGETIAFSSPYSIYNTAVRPAEFR